MILNAVSDCDNVSRLETERPSWPKGVSDMTLTPIDVAALNRLIDRAAALTLTDVTRGANRTWCACLRGPRRPFATFDALGTKGRTPE